MNTTEIRIKVREIRSTEVRGNFRPVPVQLLNDPTAAIPIIQVQELTKSERGRVPVMLTAVRASEAN